MGSISAGRKSSVENYSLGNSQKAVAPIGAHHPRYNREQLTALNIVPGLICIVLTFSTLLITTLSITRERERGTMENLLAMPVRPIEVMIAKIVPYVGIGYLQVLLILGISYLVFQLPVRGSTPLLMLALGLFIASNLVIGLTFSTIATSQMQAMQDGAIHAAPVLPAVGLHVPIQGRAGLGAVDRRNLPHHPRHADRARRAAQGQRRSRRGARAVADRGVHRGDRHHRRLVLPRDAGLMPARLFLGAQP